MVASAQISDLVTNEETRPIALNAPSGYGKLHSISGTLESAAADNSGDVYALCKLPASASVKSIRLFHDALTGASDVNVGLYTGDSSSDLTDADENCYADAVDLTSASTTGTEVAFEVRDVANINNHVWEDAGDTLGQFSEYWLCVHLQSDISVALTLSFVVDFVVD